MGSNPFIEVRTRMDLIFNPQFTGKDLLPTGRAQPGGPVAEEEKNVASEHGRESSYDLTNRCHFSTGFSLRAMDVWLEIFQTSCAESTGEANKAWGKTGPR